MYVGLVLEVGYGLSTVGFFFISIVGFCVFKVCQRFGLG